MGHANGCISAGGGEIACSSTTSAAATSRSIGSRRRMGMSGDNNALLQDSGLTFMVGMIAKPNSMMAIVIFACAKSSAKRKNKNDTCKSPWMVMILVVTKLAKTIVIVKFASEGEVEPSSTSCSRVSNSLLQSDCSKFGDNRGLDDFDPVIGSQIVKSSKHEEYDRLAVHLRNEIPENTSSTRHLDTQAGELFAISSNWDKREKSGSEAFGQSAGPINNGKSYIIGKPVAGQQETDHDSTLCAEENYEKGACTSKGMVKAKVSNVTLKTNESNKKVRATKMKENISTMIHHFLVNWAWIPVSVPPMSESEHEEWNRGFCSNGGYLPEGDTDWNQCMGEEKELTMWDVVVDMLLAARGKVQSLASGDIGNMSWISSSH
ncbi:hypothetical protein HAX54_000461 [Datura stramonium]|uniref:Uncharacterized protein n=1 Tax=Datura stramonium TaxID=4076 RepID=A0ABS8WTW8_DATST|nr:hypothetical protein [Datura stramonium]